MTMKFRMVKFARIPSYNQLFSGDPVWATLDLAGLGMDGRHMVTKSDFRFLHTLENMGPALEPNLTVLYSSHLPESFKTYSDASRLRQAPYSMRMMMLCARYGGMTMRYAAV